MEAPSLKYKKSSLEEAEKNAILDKIVFQMENEKYYISSTASLSGLAKATHETSHHVSQVINEKIGQSFFELLASYRVKEAKSILRTDLGKKLTIEEIAERVGYNSKSVFNSAFIIVMLLIIQFNSFRKMVMIVSTIPLGVIGMVIGLLLFGVPFGFMAFLGVISLAGIVINNAIVLVDRIEIEENEIKRKPQDAIIAACLQRFRPILLATFTTVLGLVPLYLGGGEMWEPMAVTIMIGLLFGTVITLLFIPAFYSVLYKVDYNGYEFDESLLG